MEPEIIADYQCSTGEGPLWHPVEKRLYWADIPEGRIFRYDPATGRHEEFYRGGVVGGFTFQADGSLLLFMERGAIAVLRNGQLSYVAKEIAQERHTRFNDVIADPAGRVFCGTMPTDTAPGNLYRLDLDGSLTPVVQGVGISNGLGFTPDRRQMYYTDSTTRRIYLFDYDVNTGGMSNQRVFVETPEGEGIPDGMTVDAEGYVWSARWDGWSLFRYSPAGEQVQRVRFPAKKVSSVAFGGADLTDMYVTTAGASDRNENGGGAGALFRLNLGVRGATEFFSRIRL